MFRTRLPHKSFLYWIQCHSESMPRIAKVCVPREASSQITSVTMPVGSSSSCLKPVPPENISVCLFEGKSLSDFVFRGLCFLALFQWACAEPCSGVCLLAYSRLLRHCVSPFLFPLLARAFPLFGIGSFLSLWASLSVPSVPFPPSPSHLFLVFCSFFVVAPAAPVPLSASRS